MKEDNKKRRRRIKERLEFKDKAPRAEVMLKLIFLSLRFTTRKLKLRENYPLSKSPVRMTSLSRRSFLS